MATLHRLHRIRSRWFNGAPTTCMHPECGAAFEGAAFAGKSGKLYCTRHCRDDNNDTETVEDRARRAS